MPRGRGMIAIILVSAGTGITGIALLGTGGGSLSLSEAMPRGRGVIAIILVSASTGITGIALRGAGRGRHSLGKAMPRGRGMVTVVLVSAVAGIAGITLLGTGGRHNRLRQGVWYRGQDRVQKYPAHRATPRGQSCLGTGGRLHRLPRLNGMLVGNLLHRITGRQRHAGQHQKKYVSEYVFHE